MEAYISRVKVCGVRIKRLKVVEPFDNERHVLRKNTANLHINFVPYQFGLLNL